MTMMMRIMKARKLSLKHFEQCLLLNFDEVDDGKRLNEHWFGVSFVGNCSHYQSSRRTTRTHTHVGGVWGASHWEKAAILGNWRLVIVRKFDFDARDLRFMARLSVELSLNHFFANRFWCFCRDFFGGLQEFVLRWWDSKTNPFQSSRLAGDSILRFLLRGREVEPSIIMIANFERSKSIPYESLSDVASN